MLLMLGLSLYVKNVHLILSLNKRAARMWRASSWTLVLLWCCALQDTLRSSTSTRSMETACKTTCTIIKSVCLHNHETAIHSWDSAIALQLWNKFPICVEHTCTPSTYFTHMNSVCIHTHPHTLLRTVPSLSLCPQTARSYDIIWISCTPTHNNDIIGYTNM